MAEEYRAGVRMRRVGRELRRWRERIGITGAEAAKRVRWSTAKLSKIENAQQPIQGVDVLALGIVYDLKPKERDRLFHACLSAAETGWWQDYDEQSLVPAVQDFVELESEAALLRTFKPDLIPGLLQTERYATELIRTSLAHLDEEGVAQRAKVRTIRQARLLDEEPLQLHAVIWEAALRQNVGGSTVMSAQLDRLREYADLPNVEVLILPLSSGAFAGLGSTFQILSFRETHFGDVVYVENLTQGMYIETAEDVEKYRGAFQSVRDVALDAEESLRLIKEITDDL